MADFNPLTLPNYLRYIYSDHKIAQSVFKITANLIVSHLYIMADLSIKLSSTRTLSVVRNDDAIVAKITDNVTGREMTLGWGALTKLMASVPFVTRARESLLVDCANERFGKIPRLPLKRKLDFDSVVNDSPVRGSPISGLDLYRGTEMIPAPPKMRRIMERVGGQ